MIKIKQSASLLRGIASATAFCGLALTATAQGGPSEKANPSDRAKAIVDHWTSDRLETATPRDLFLDHRGLAYIRGADGSLEPYGHTTKHELKQNQIKSKEKPTPRAKPTQDTTPPTISNLTPTDGSEISAEQVFSAVVTDNSAVRSVTFNITYGGQTYNFDGTFVGNDTYQTSVTGFAAGSGSWNVSATDTAKRGGNSATSGTNNFTVGDGGGGGGGGGGGSSDVVTNERWADGGAIQTAAGRLFYEMPNRRRGRQLTWAGYVCSGTVTTDSATGRSVIITAAHCVYNDEFKQFARNVLFIPNQDQTTGTATDTNCSNDPLGCWTASFGVVDSGWTTTTFPNNIPYDYAYYVVNDTGAHTGDASISDSLENAVGSFDVQFSAPNVDDGTAGTTTPDYTHALGYSYSDDPFFMYCAEDMTTEGTDNWWLSQCGLSGGSSGGPWIQPMSSGSGPLMSVNSWGYTTSPGMAGPKLNGTSAQCLFDVARTTDFNAVLTQDGEAGVVVDPASCQ